MSERSDKSAAPLDPAQAATAAKLATVGLAVQGALAVVALGVALATGSFVALAVAAHLAAGTGAWAAGALLAGRRRRAAEEGVEDRRLERVAESEGRRPLFERASHEASDVRLGAALAILLATLEVGLGVALFAYGWQRAAEPLGRLLGGAAALAGSAFALLLLAKYTVALAGGPAGSPLGLAAAGGRRAASGALVAFVAAVVLAVTELAPSLALDRVGFVLAVGEAILGLELAVALLLELYRPRRRGDVPRPAFESRLLALVAEPGGIARSLARAIDYQFGFRLSDTWVYRLVERGLAPLAIFAAVSFWLLSSLVVVPEGERAILEHLGTPAPGSLEPGLHVKLPWPIETVVQFPTSRVREVVLGPDDEDEPEAPPNARRHADLWTRAHRKQSEFFILVARPRGSGADASADPSEAPVDLLEARIPVHFVVADPVAFSRGAVAPERLLKVLGEHELAALGCSHGVFDLLGPGSEAASSELLARIQKSADEHALGITVLDLNLSDLHPSVDVAAAFQAETGALEDREAQRLKELAFAAKLKPDAVGQARNILDQARTNAARRRLLADADSGRFGALLALDRAAPHAFRELRMLRGLEEALSGPQRKIVVSKGARGMVDVDLADKFEAASDLSPGSGK